MTRTPRKPADTAVEPAPTSPPSGARVLLGRISGAHGIRGDVLIRAFTQNPADIAAYGTLSDATGTRSFKLRVVRVTPKGVVARIDGVSDRNAAEPLRGLELFADRARLPPTSAREYYHADLIGLAAMEADGRVIGRVVGVQNFGAGDLLEIRRDGCRETELLPFTDGFVPEVDLSAGRVIVAMPHEGPDED